jgi:hypothetical protein
LVESTLPITKVTAIRLEALTDSSLPQKGPGRADHGNFVLSEFTAQAQPATTRTVRLTFSGASATFNQGAFTASAAIDGQEGTGWAVGGGGIGRDQSAVFTLAEPLALPAGVKLMFSLGQHYPDGKHLLGKFRISVTDQPVPETR